ncbi:MAG: hypothetical protein PWQ87_571 [Candidatus Woesearchaeota archaeon]|nr:hypothetical protein [Candidatus Woesearchaeota archaeon]
MSADQIKEKKDLEPDSEETDYVIISREELDTLKKEIEKLKKSYKGYAPVTIEELNDSILNLNHSIHMLLELFEGAAKEFKERHETNEDDSTDRIVSRLEALIDQNKAIAKGILYLVKSDKEEKDRLEKQREEQRKLREALMRNERPKSFTQSNPAFTPKENPIQNPFPEQSSGNPQFNAQKRTPPSFLNDLEEFDELQKQDTNPAVNSSDEEKDEHKGRFPFHLNMPPKK